MNKIFFFLYFCFSLQLFAAKPFCQTFTLHDINVSLSTDEPLLMVFHNISEHNIYLVNKKNSTSSLIAPGRWSQFSLVKQSVTFSCIESLPGHEQQVPCKNVLSVCQFLLKSKHITTTAWLSENLTTSPLTQ